MVKLTQIGIRPLYVLITKVSHVSYTRPVRGRRFKNSRQNIRLLPLQGALLIAIIPRAMPWARSFWTFSPYLNHMRQFNDFYYKAKSPPFFRWAFDIIILLSSYSCYYLFSFRCSILLNANARELWRAISSRNNVISLNNSHAAVCMALGLR